MKKRGRWAKQGAIQTRANETGRPMKVTQRVKKILDNYESDNPGTKANLARILMQGKLGGTGKVVILPVDQGFEHGPARSFARQSRRPTIRIIISSSRSTPGSRPMRRRSA